jgi:hypothetical protein
MADPLYRIRDWSTIFENNRTRELKRLDWVPLPNKLDGFGVRSILSRLDGLDIFAIWILLIELASKCNPRGSLIRSRGTPHTPATLAMVFSSPALTPEKIASALDVLCLPEMRWVEMVESIPQEGAGFPQEGAGFCHRTELNRTGIEREQSQLQSQSFNGSVLRERLSIFKGLTDRMLPDTAAMMVWLAENIPTDPHHKLADTDQQRILILSAATFAMEKSKAKKKVQYFARIVGGENWDWIKPMYRVAGENRFAKWKASQNGNGKPHERPTDSRTAAASGNGLPRTPPAAKS